ncbi:MAG: hypothetical protein GY852_04175 [bacterium]|nr:hypothetical protein [bacterium]
MPVQKKVKKAAREVASDMNAIKTDAVNVFKQEASQQDAQAAERHAQIYEQYGPVIDKMIDLSKEIESKQDSLSEFNQILVEFAPDAITSAHIAEGGMKAMATLAITVGKPAGELVEFVGILDKGMVPTYSEIASVFKDSGELREEVTTYSLKVVQDIQTCQMGLNMYTLALGNLATELKSEDSADKPVKVMAAYEILNESAKLLDTSIKNMDNHMEMLSSKVAAVEGINSALTDTSKLMAQTVAEAAVFAGATKLVTMGSTLHKMRKLQQLGTTARAGQAATQAAVKTKMLQKISVGLKKIGTLKPVALGLSGARRIGEVRAARSGIKGIMNIQSGTRGAMDAENLSTELGSAGAGYTLD